MARKPPKVADKPPQKKAAPAKKPGRAEAFGPFQISRQDVEWKLQELRERYEAGSGEALLVAVDCCLSHDFVAPRWVADAFGERLSEWRSLGCETLDAAFGVARTHLPAKRDKARCMYAVYAIAERAELESLPRDDEFFAAISEVLDIGKSRAKEYLKAARKEIAAQRASQKRRNPRGATVAVYDVNADLEDRLYKRILEYRGRKS